MSATQQRGGLLLAKLRSLLSGRATDALVAADFPGGAALVAGSTAWVLLDANPLAALGPALVWAERRAVSELNLVVEEQAGVIARRAGLFRDPPRVWVVEGNELHEARADPPAGQMPARSAPELDTLLVDAGLEVVIEEGIVRGEVLGLEVARVVHGATSSSTPLEEPALEVGVGHADRELTALVHGSLPPTERLERVARIVREKRRADAEPHPLNQLASERWLRAELVAEPARISLRELRPAPPAVPRPNLRDPAVAIAVGRDESGGDVVVACSVGIHLDAVPAGADARLALAPDARLLLVLPARDAHPVTRALADRLVQPAEIVALDGEWRS